MERKDLEHLEHLRMIHFELVRCVWDLYHSLSNILQASSLVESCGCGRESMLQGKWAQGCCFPGGWWRWFGSLPGVPLLADSGQAGNPGNPGIYDKSIGT